MSEELDVEFFGWSENLAVEETTAHQAVCFVLKELKVDQGHLAVTICSSQEIAQLNLRYRGKDVPTDVLAFPIDEDEQVDGPRELGDVIVCPQHSEGLLEVIVHGVLHLCGYDHETDDGEMLLLQGKLLAAIQ